jgi:hypothetical protein
MIIPLGLGGGAVVGFVASIFIVGTGGRIRGPGDPGDAPAMLSMFIMFEGAAAGAVLGVITAIALYFKRRRERNLK